MTSVAVIVATFNGERYIKSQLLSILGQTYKDVTIFVRDDGSSDQTISILNSIDFSARVRLLHSDPTPKQSAAGNFFSALTSIELESYSYIFFSDQDDIWDPQKIERAITKMNSESAAGYSSDLVAFNEQRRAAWHIKKSSPQKSHDYLFQGASAGCTYALTQSAARIVKDRIINLSGEDVKPYSHDWLIYSICRSHGLHWAMDTQPTVFYRQHEGNVYGALPSMGGLIARWKQSNSGWYRRSVLWNAQFLVGTPEELKIIDAVRQNSFLNRIWLAMNAHRFRRRPRDVVLLAFSFIAGSF